MDVLTPDRFLILSAFLGGLLLLWVGVRLFRDPLAARLKPAEQPLELSATLSLGGDGRALLLRAEGQTVLVVTGRKSGTAMIALPADRAGAPAAPLPIGPLRRSTGGAA